MSSNKLKACFVILHYKTIEDTRKCISTILSMACKELRIIIIDNGSGDNTGKVLKDEYKYESRVQVEIVDTNMGFSKGNNYGYAIAKKFKPEYMIVCNSDIIFMQENTIDLIDMLYKENHYSVLGPDIYVPEYEFHSNPIALKPESIDKLKNTCQRKSKQLKHLDFVCVCDMVQDRVKSFKKQLKHIVGFKRNALPAKNNVLLQGACFILSKDFLSKYDELFFPMDSFYYEEYFLYKKCIEDGMIMRYDPQIKVLHTGSSATKKTMNTRKRKKEFVLKNQIESIEKYIDECEIK